MELENIKERTEVGRKVFVQKGGKLGRPFGTSESQRNFLQKQKSQNIIRYLRRGMTFKEISVLLNVSPKTIKKVKDIMIFLGET